MDETCPYCGDEGWMGCPNCSGSGEGMSDGTRCWRCMGLGGVPCDACSWWGDDEEY